MQRHMAIIFHILPRQEAKSKNAQYNELLGAPIAMLNGFLCAA